MFRGKIINDYYFTIRVKCCNFLNLYERYVLQFWSVFNNFLLIDATDRSKISSDQKLLFFAVSPFSFFANTLFKKEGHLNCCLQLHLPFTATYRKIIIFTFSWIEMFKKLFSILCILLYSVIVCLILVSLLLVSVLNY